MREVAWRVFAGEYNDSTLEISQSGERTPSYVVTPLGAKVNRLFIVGVLTDIENLGTEQGPMWRARITDPTGTFHVYAGQFQPMASTILSRLKPPVFAAVCGKSRAYKPETGAVYTSIRPEIVKVVDAYLRDHWILECCRSMKKRLEAAREAYRMNPPTESELVKLGFSPSISAGLVKAVQHYGNIDLSRFSSMLAEAVRYLIPEFQQYRSEEADMAGRTEKAEVKTKEENKEEKLEEDILSLINQLDTEGKGASWDAILEGAKKLKVGKDELEEVVNSLLDKGLIYEPVLGRMKKI